MWTIKRYSKGGIKVIILTFYTKNINCAETAIYIRNILPFLYSESFKIHVMFLFSQLVVWEDSYSDITTLRRQSDISKIRNLLGTDKNSHGCLTQF